MRDNDGDAPAADNILPAIIVVARDPSQRVAPGLNRGDCALLPAGTGSLLPQASADFLVVGAYPPGQRWDLCRRAFAGPVDSYPFRNRTRSGDQRVPCSFSGLALDDV
jgi:hypothetical protein